MLDKNQIAAASKTLHDHWRAGTKFDGLDGLRSVLHGRQDEFAATVTEKLLTYALGREIEYFDQPVIRQIARDAAPGGYRWSSIIMGITKSMPFQMRMRRVEP